MHFHPMIAFIVIGMVMLEVVDASCPDRCICRDYSIKCNDMGLLKIPTIDYTVTLIDLQRNDIKKLGDVDLMDFSDLEILNLHANKLTILNTKSFYNLVNLKKLNLSSNSLKRLPLNVLKFQENLLTLDLSDNKIEEFNDNIFENCIQLTTLLLQRNRLTENIFYKLSKVKSLRILDLSYNPLKNLPYSMLADTAISNLKVNNALLSHISPTAIHTMASLEYLSMDNNNLKSLHEEYFKDLQALTKISVRNNTFDCDCQLHRVVQYFYDTDILVEGHSLTCAAVDGRKFHISLAHDDFVSSQFCELDWSTRQTSSTTTTLRPTTLRAATAAKKVASTNTAAFCDKLFSKLALALNYTTQHSMTFVWSRPYEAYKQDVQLFLAEGNGRIISQQKTDVGRLSMTLNDLEPGHEYIVYAELVDCDRKVVMTASTSSVSETIVKHEPIMNWTYIYIGSIIGALGLLLAITCAVACYLLSKRKHQRMDNKRRPMTVITGSLERSSHLNGMSSLQRTGVCMMDGSGNADNLYESISRHASLSQKTHNPSASMASLAMRRDSSTPGAGFSMTCAVPGQYPGTPADASAAAPVDGHNSMTRYSAQVDQHQHQHQDGQQQQTPVSRNRSNSQHYNPAHNHHAHTDSYTPMHVSRPAPVHDPLLGEQEAGYLQPSPGPVPAPRVPAQYANSPLLEHSRTSVHQYEPDTKPTTFH